MSTNAQTVKTIVAVSVGVIVGVGTVYVWPSHGEKFGRVTTNRAVASDVSERLSSLSPPRDEDEEEAEREEEGRVHRADSREGVASRRRHRADGARDETGGHAPGQLRWSRRRLRRTERIRSRRQSVRQRTRRRPESHRADRERARHRGLHEERQASTTRRERCCSGQFRPTTCSRTSRATARRGTRATSSCATISSRTAGSSFFRCSRAGQFGLINPSRSVRLTVRVQA